MQIRSSARRFRRHPISDESVLFKFRTVRRRGASAKAMHDTVDRQWTGIGCAESATDYCPNLGTADVVAVTLAL